MLSEVRQDLRDPRSPRVLGAEIGQRANHVLDAAAVLQKDLAKLLESEAGLASTVPIGGGDGLPEVLGGVEEVDDLGTAGDLGAQEPPVVLRRVRDLDDGQVRT